MKDTAMQESTSLRGKTARGIVRAVNHMPLLGPLRVNGELQNIVSEREPEWKCPEHLRRSIIDMESYSMEMIGPVDAAEPNSRRHAILQLHGGGYYGRMHNTYRDAAALYVEISGGADVLCPDYRVAPEFPYPAALEDAAESYRWLLEQDYDPERIVLAGDSAGGGLALALTLYLKDHGLPLPAGVVTMSAWTDLSKSGDSYQEKYDADPIFGGTRNSLVYKEGYYAGHDPMDPYISPVNGDYRAFPALLMQVGEEEMLLSDTLSVAEKARFAGGRVKLHVYPGMWHIFQMGFKLYPEAMEAWREVGHFLHIVWK